MSTPSPPQCVNFIIATQQLKHLKSIYAIDCLVNTVSTECKILMAGTTDPWGMKINVEITAFKELYSDKERMTYVSTRREYIRRNKGNAYVHPQYRAMIFWYRLT